MDSLCNISLTPSRQQTTQIHSMLEKWISFKRDRNKHVALFYVQRDVGVCVFVIP